MTSKHLKQMTAVLFALAGHASTVAYAADQYQLAYTDTISQDGVKTQVTSGHVTKSGPSVTAASVVATLSRMSFVQQSTLNLNGKSQPVILRRIFPAGDGGTSGETDILFSIQVCRTVERDPEDANRLSCRDQPAPPPMFQLGKLVMVAGQSVTMAFPEGITWTYQIRETDWTRAAR